MLQYSKVVGAKTVAIIIIIIIIIISLIRTNAA